MVQQSIINYDNVYTSCTLTTKWHFWPLSSDHNYVNILFFENIRKKPAKHFCQNSSPLVRFQDCLAQDQTTRSGLTHVKIIPIVPDPILAQELRIKKRASRIHYCKT